MPIRRILFIAEGQLGDLLLLTPALRATRESSPRSHITVLVVQRRRYEGKRESGTGVLGIASGGGTTAVITDSDLVDEVVEVDRPRVRSLKGLARLRAEWEIVSFLRKAKPDAVFCTFPQDRFVLWAFLSGARLRVGQKRQALARFLTTAPDLERGKGGVLRYYADLVAAAGAVVRRYDTEYRVRKPARDWAEEYLRTRGVDGTLPLVAVHPGATGLYKIWPPERFAALIDELQESKLARVILCGSDFDREIVGRVREHLRTGVLEVNPGGSVPRLAALLQCCTLSIVNDSGPRHLSLAVGTRTIAFMPSFQDREWGIPEYGESSVLLQGSDRCSGCAEGECNNIIPPGQEYG
ncbi:MAG: glycosyltransferase family 9 protein, partial [Bacteroidota bacterium]